MMQIGLRLHDSEKLPLEELLPRVHERGFTCAHLALSKARKEYPCTASALTPGYAAYLKHLFAKNEVDIAVLGNYLNPGTPDEEQYRAFAEKYVANFRFASLLGCGMVGTETGAPNTAYTYCPACRSEEAYQTLLHRMAPLVEAAEKFGVIFAIEPVARHIIWNPQRARRLLDDIASPNLKILFDPVNLLDDDNMGDRERIVQEGLELLGDDIAMIHLKDFVVENGARQSVGPGLGVVDHTTLLRFVKREKPFIFATMENTKPENEVQCRRYLEELWETV